MGAATSCFHVPDVQDNTASNNSIFCLCPKCFFRRFKNKHRNIFRLEHVSSPNQQSSSSNSGLVSNNVQVEVELIIEDDVGVNKKFITQDVSKEESSEPAAKDLPISTFPSLDDDEEDVCPTCLEDYSEENPKIIAKCCHHYHLSCIYEWMERSENCPMCGKLMLFDE